MYLHSYSRCFYSFVFLLNFIFLGNCTGSLKSSNPEDCRPISGVPGPEDFVIDRETGIMYISSHERRIENQFGSIYAVDLKSKDQKPVRFDIEYPKSFRPHGISFAKTPNGKKLYILSHLDDYFGESHAIEVFSIEKNSIKHELSLTNENLISPNDLFAMPDGRIFVSNDHGSNGKMAQFFQDAFRLSSSAITLYDGKSWYQLDEKIAFGNGIHVRIENGKEFLYRASTLDSKVTKYEMQFKDSKISLTKIMDIPIDSGADNFELDDNGDILIVGHTSLYKFLRHKSSKENLSPTQVFRILPDGKVKEIFADSGELISGGSTGAIFQSRLYIAQVFEPFVLSCKAPK